MEKRYMNNSLIVFLRKPIRGHVKSRLAKDVGEKKALEIYNWLLELTHLACYRLKFPVNLYFDQSEGSLPNWADRYLCHVQKGKDLGIRMKNAFNEQLKISGKTVMIGSDCPEIDEEIISKAFNVLTDKDIVLGPAKDGGIYLIGLKNLDRKLFQNVPWGGPGVFEKLEENAGALSLKVDVLEERQDIDIKRDFLKWQNEFEEFKAFQKYVDKRTG